MNKETSSKDRFRLVLFSSTLAAFALVLPLMVSGCLSVSIIGGRHQSVTFIGSDNNDDASADMEADSQTSDFMKDLLKDLYPANVTPPVFAPVGTTENLNESGDSDENIEESDEDGAGVEPGDIPEITPQAGLWKPLGEDGSGSRIILPTRLTAPLPPGPYTEVELEDMRLNGDNAAAYASNVLSVHVRSTTGGHEATYTYNSVANGWREHYKNNSTGNDWANGAPIHIAATMMNGPVQRWTVPDPRERFALE